MIVYKGESFKKNCTWTPEGDEPLTLEGVTLLCDVQTSDGVKYPVTVNVSSDHIHFTLIAATDDWAPGEAALDFLIKVSADYSFTEQIPFEVKRPITRKLV